jgi:signal transduction histidine kinase
MSQEKLASLGTLTAGIAHELRNPLNFVTNYARGSIELSQDLLETIQPLLSSLDMETSEFIKSLVADLQENAAMIRIHSQRVENIIFNMMQHARTDNVKAAPQPTHINDLLDQSLKLSYHSKKMQDSDFNITIQANYADDLDLVNILPGAMCRAFINLIDNACDAMRFQQAQIKDDSSKDYQPTLRLSTCNLGDRVEIRICDNGCGIVPEIQAKILDPFFTTKPSGEGTGLGLSLTHDIIVKQHQGTLTINTNAANSSQFTEIIVTIPYRYG